MSTQDLSSRTLIVCLLLTLQGCGIFPETTTPRLDAQFGQSLERAKAQQSLPAGPGPSAGALAEGAGLPTSAEIMPGLQAQQRGRAVAPALGPAR